MATQHGVVQKLLQELAKGNEITISPLRITGKGGFGVLLAFLLGLLLLLFVAAL